MPSEGSLGAAVSYERGTPVRNARRFPRSSGLSILKVDMLGSSYKPVNFREETSPGQADW